MYTYNVLECIHMFTFIQYCHSKISQLTAYIQNMYIYIVNKIIVTLSRTVHHLLARRIHIRASADELLDDFRLPS